MTTLIIIAAIYLAVGITLSTLVSYRIWQEGEDFTIGDLGLWLVRAVIWPGAVIAWIDDHMDRPWPEIVLIPGNKSARVLKELKKDVV